MRSPKLSRLDRVSVSLFMLSNLLCTNDLKAFRLWSCCTALESHRAHFYRKNKCTNKAVLGHHLRQTSGPSHWKQQKEVMCYVYPLINKHPEKRQRGQKPTNKCWFSQQCQAFTSNDSLCLSNKINMRLPGAMRLLALR